MGLGCRVGRRLAPVVLGVSMLCASASTARAENPVKAGALADAAAARAKQGERRVAIDLYEEAYALAPRREYLREIGALYDTLAYGGDSRDVRLALLYLERYLADEGETADRAIVEARVARLRSWKSRMRAEPQPPPPPSSVPLDLLAYRADNTYQVSLGGTGCTTPCTLQVPPGPTVLKTQGSGNVDLQLVVPPRPAQLRLQHTDSSGYIAGAILLPSGLVMASTMWAFALLCNDFNGSCEAANLILWPTLGGTAFIAGLVLLIRGRVVAPSDANHIELVARGTSPFRLTSFGAAPQHGGGTAGLTFEF